MIANGHIPPDPFDEVVTQTLGRHVTASHTFGSGTSADVRHVELDDGTVVVAKYFGVFELAHAAAFGGGGPPLFDSYETHPPIAREFWTVRCHVYAVYPALVHVYYLGDR